MSHRRRLARLTAVVAGLAAAALGPTASPALAEGFTLKLTAPSRVVVGTPTLIHVTGTIPREHFWYAYWLSVVSIPPRVMSTCPASHSAAKQIANASGGSILVFTQREVPDANGNFRAPVGINPYAPGRALICAYTDDGATNTLAIASLDLTVHAKGGGAAAPSSLGRPRVTRAGALLTCSPGRWSNRPTRFSFAWFADGRPVARGPRLRVGAVLGRRVQCRVTASNGAGSRTAASAPVLVR
jgi:hypothetical protein